MCLVLKYFFLREFFSLADWDYPTQRESFLVQIGGCLKCCMCAYFTSNYSFLLTAWLSVLVSSLTAGDWQSHSFVCSGLFVQVLAVLASFLCLLQYQMSSDSIILFTIRRLKSVGCLFTSGGKQTLYIRANINLPNVCCLQGEVETLCTFILSLTLKSLCTQSHRISSH